MEQESASDERNVSEPQCTPVGVWKELVVVRKRWSRSKKQHPDVRCKYCSKEINHAQPKKNLRPHIRCCPEAPAEVRVKYPPSASKRSREPTVEVGTPSKRARTEAHVSRAGVFRPVSIAEKKEFHLEIARAFYTSGIPFRVIENQGMRCILTKYRPEMTLPSRQDLSTTHLDSVYAEELDSVVKVLREQKYIVIVSDGWSDPNNESIINFMVTSPFIRPIFWSSERCGDKRHTGEYMASQLGKVIRDVEEIVGKGSVCGVVSDNAPNMRKSWELLVKKLPNLTCNGCAAHTLNLLLKDMFGIAFLDDVLKNAVAVTKFVRKRPGLLYQFKAKQRSYFGSRQSRRALVIPVATRWYSRVNCISSVVRNEEVLRELFADNSLLERYRDAVTKINRVETILADNEFWTNARMVLRLVKPVIKALGALENDGCCLSMVYHYFRELQYHPMYNHDSSDAHPGVLVTIKGQIRSRWRTIKRESVLAAFLLDPSKAIEDFEENDLEKAVDFYVDLASRAGLPLNASRSDFRRVVLAFVRMKNSWGPEESENNSQDSPLDWWMLKSKRFPLLQQFATRILSMPTSSAASERSWSVHSFIHNKRRNRLKPSRVEKLVFVCSNTGDKGATSEIFYRENEHEDDASIRQEDSDSSDASTPDVSGGPSASRSHPRRSRANSQSSSRHTTPTRRSNNCPATTPRTRRVLFPPTDCETPSNIFTNTSTRWSHEVEIALTQSTAQGQVFSRADEVQLVSPQLAIEVGSSNDRRFHTLSSLNQPHPSPRQCIGPCLEN